MKRLFAGKMSFARTFGVGFWGATVVFFVLYAFLPDMAARAFANGAIQTSFSVAISMLVALIAWTAGICRALVISRAHETEYRLMSGGGVAMVAAAIAVYVYAIALALNPAVRLAHADIQGEVDSLAATLPVEVEAG